MLQRMLDAYPKDPFPASLRLILLGGAAAPLKLLERAASLDLPVALTYGLTETASQVATALPDEVRRKPGSAGKPLLFTRVSIQDEKSRELPLGEIGEIVVTGPTVMPGYYRHPEQTGGTFHTGDLGTLDEDGDLWIVQRRSDLIVSGGENVYPAEVERVLLEHPSVREACVVGIRDEDWGEKVAAALVLQPGAAIEKQEIQDFCRQHLAGYKLPRLIRVLPELPRTGSGKIQRAAVCSLWDSSNELAVALPEAGRPAPAAAGLPARLSGPRCRLGTGRCNLGRPISLHPARPAGPRREYASPVGNSAEL
jgi:O-succinylbenzoic acid--CoA ligase